MSGSWSYRILKKEFGGSLVITNSFKMYIWLWLKSLIKSVKVVTYFTEKVAQMVEYLNHDLETTK